MIEEADPHISERARASASTSSSDADIISGRFSVLTWINPMFPDGSKAEFLRLTANFRGVAVRQHDWSISVDVPSETPEAGVTLLEMVCVLAIIGLLAAIALPRLALSTSQPRLESLALEVSALLKADRNAALASGGVVTTAVDARDRMVRSGYRPAIVQVPDDVVFDALLPQRCNGRPALSTISFLANGMSCGGVIRLTHAKRGVEVRVNWLTGDVDIVAQNTK